MGLNDRLFVLVQAPYMVCNGVQWWLLPLCQDPDGLVYLTHGGSSASPEAAIEAGQVRPLTGSVTITRH